MLIPPGELDGGGGGRDAGRRGIPPGTIGGGLPMIGIIIPGIGVTALLLAKADVREADRDGN